MFFDVVAGIGPGYFAANAQKKEAEVKQGSNPYLASAFQVQKVGTFSSLSSRIVSLIPYAPLRALFSVTNGAMPFAGMVLCPTFAAIKQGHYEPGVNAIEPHYPKVASYLPRNLDEKRVQLISYLSDNIGDIAQKASYVAMAVLPFLGFGSLALGMAAPLVLEAANSANLIPTKISLFMEKYMPSVANASLLVGGGVFTQTVAAATLASNVPSVNDFVLKRAEQVFLKCLPVNGSTLDEVEASWEERQDLSYEEIKYILQNGASYLYEINPAHCSKEAMMGVEMPVNHDYKQFLFFLEEIDWIHRYPLLKNAFRDDNRFIELLKEKWPGLSNETIRKDFEGYLETYARERGQSKEAFLASQLHLQMQALVRILSGEVIQPGFLEDIEEAKEACSLILGYLFTGKPSLIEKEDLLIKLAIEAGDYCARGIKRAAKEMQLGILSTQMTNLEDPRKAYVLQIRHHLQYTRQQILQNAYQKMIEMMVRGVKEGLNMRFSMQSETTDEDAIGVAQDVHTLDFYRLQLTLGFYPLTEIERRKFGISELTSWVMNGPLRTMMYEKYQERLDESIRALGDVHFTNYILQAIQGLPSLTEEQKEEFIEELSLCNDGEETLKGFRRLFFVMQGVLKVKSIYAGWCDLSSDSEAEELPIDDWELVNE